MNNRNHASSSEQKRIASLRRTRIFLSVLTFASAILAILSLIGIIVAVLMLNFGEQSDRKDLILYILTGSFAGGAALFALLSWLFSKLTGGASERELDCRERLFGEESFFVGEGTLLTFCEEGVKLHGEREGKADPILVPYAETRYISICTRRRPQEKGSWCVAIEVPVRYLSKKGEGKRDEKVLVQADAKERLYQALEKHSLVLLGEERNEGKENKKFVPLKKFYLPNRKKRRNALIGIAVGALLIGGAIPLGLFVSASAGALAGAAGIVFAARSVWGFIRARAVFGIYEEGIYWSESSGGERLFLKWDDVGKVTAEEKNGYPVLVFECSYGRYAIPAVEGAYERIKELRKEKCNGED